MAKLHKDDGEEQIVDETADIFEQYGGDNVQEEADEDILF